MRGALAEEAVRDGTDVSSLRVLGSIAADPRTLPTDRRRLFGSLPGLRYHQIVLGFVSLATGSRWLTNAESQPGCRKFDSGQKEALAMRRSADFRKTGQFGQ